MRQGAQVGLAVAAARHTTAAATAVLRPAHPTNVRLQLREALAGLASPHLQQQAVFAAEALLQASAGALLEPFLREALRPAELAALPGSVRRLRYRLAAHALRQHPAHAEWGGTLLLVRDSLVDRCGLEDHATAGTSVCRKRWFGCRLHATSLPTAALSPSTAITFTFLHRPLQPRSWPGWQARWRRQPSRPMGAAA